MSDHNKTGDDAGNQLKKIEIAQTIVNKHHSALWEAQKHFTWWLSILLSAQLITYTSDTLNSLSKTIFVTIIGIVGIFICRIAFLSLTRESEYYCEAFNRYRKAFNDIYTDHPITRPASTANPSLVELFRLFLKGKLRIREGFNLVFYVFGFVFFIITIYTILSKHVMKWFFKIILDLII